MQKVSDHMYEFDDTFRPLIRSDLRTGRQTHDRKGHIAAVIQDMVLKGVFHPGYQASPQIVQMFPCLDGKTEVSKLPERLQAELGLHLSLDAIRRALTGLARYDLLDTPEIRQKRASLEASFQQASVRPMGDPSGGLYPANPDELRKALEHSFLKARTKKDAGFSPPSSSPLAFLLPHVALLVSGPTTACALQVLLSTPLPDCYIIIGPNHVYPGPPRATTLSHPFQTPLGTVEIDQEMLSLLKQFSDGSIVTDYISQYRDHSIEIMLPFLQWIHSQSDTSPGKPVRIVPLLLTGERHRPGMPEPESHIRIWQLIARAIRHVLSSSAQRTIVIVSGDFVHRGPLFQFVPFSGTEKKDFYAWDRPLLQAIEKADAEGFLKAFQETNSCVGRPMYTILNSLETCRWLMADYHVPEGNVNAVSFASFVAYARV